MSIADQARIEQFELPQPEGEGRFRIKVWANEAQPGADVPVLFVTDGDFLSVPAVEIARLYGLGGSMPTPMVVGIGYGADDQQAFNVMRTPHLTPPLGENGRRKMGALMPAIGDDVGRDAAFLDFIVDTLMPEIARRYPKSSTTKRALFGHSLGGLFVSRALLTRPEAFSAYLIGSAALNWDEFVTLSLLPEFAARVTRLASKPRVFIGVGGKEQDVPDEVPAGSPFTVEQLRAFVEDYRVIDASREFAESLRDAGLDDVTFVSFEGEDHITVITALLMRGINLFVPRPF